MNPKRMAFQSFIIIIRLYVAFKYVVEQQPSVSINFFCVQLFLLAHRRSTSRQLVISKRRNLLFDQRRRLHYAIFMEHICILYFVKGGRFVSVHRGRLPLSVSASRFSSRLVLLAIQHSTTLSERDREFGSILQTAII